MKIPWLPLGLATLAAGAGCASPTIAGVPSPGVPSPAALAADQARREERLKIMQQYWAEQTAGPPGETAGAPAAPAALDYPAGNYAGINFAPRRTADPALTEPDRQP